MKTNAEHAELLWRALPRHPYLVLRAMRHIVTNYKNFGVGALNHYEKINAWLWGPISRIAEKKLRGEEFLRAATVEVKRSLAAQEDINRILHQ